MRKLTYVVMAIALPLLWSCEGKDFSLVLAQELVFDFVSNDQDGVWFEVEEVTREDVVEDIEAEIDLSEVDISTVDIEGIILRISDQPQALQGVEAMNCYYVPAPGDTIAVFTNESLMLDVNNEVVVNNLAEAGVVALKEKIRAYLESTDFEPFTIISEGRSVPEGTPLSMTITIDFRNAIVFVEELEVPWFIGKSQ